MTSKSLRPVQHDAWAGSTCVDWVAIGRYVLGRRTSEGGYCFYRTPEWAVEAERSGHVGCAGVAQASRY